MKYLLSLLLAAVSIGSTANAQSSKAKALVKKPVAPEVMKDNNSPRITTDTLGAGWQDLADEQVTFLYGSVYGLHVDKKGNVYSFVDKTPNSKTFCKLVDGKWEPMDKGLGSGWKIQKFKNSDELYMEVESGIKKWDGAEWVPFLDIMQRGDMFKQLTFGDDGNIYGFKPISWGSVSHTVAKWNGKEWVGIPGFPDQVTLFESSYPDLRVNKDGKIIFYGNKSILTFDGKIKSEIPTPPYGLLHIDETDDFFIYSFRDDSLSLLKWNGAKWIYVDHPNPNFFRNKPKTYVVGKQLFLFSEGELSAFTYGKWKLIYEKMNLSGFMRDENLFFTDHGTFSGNYHSHKLEKYTEEKIVQLEAWPIPLADGFVPDAGQTAALNNYRLVKKNGKYGLYYKGNLLVYPAMDKIEATIPGSKCKPGQDCIYFTLNSGGQFLTTYFVKGSHTDLSTTIYGADDVTQLSKECSQCKGKGNISAYYETEYTEGDWVEGSSSTTSKSNYEKVWNAVCRCYEGVRTVTTSTNRTSGQRLPGKTVKKYIPGGRCSVCNGKGILESMGYSNFEYDPVNSQYKKVTIERGR